MNLSTAFSPLYIFTEKLLRLLYKDMGMHVDKPKPNIVYWFENKNDQSFFLTNNTQYCKCCDEFVEDVQEWKCTYCYHSFHYKFTILKTFR